MQTSNYIAAAAIEQHDLLAIDATATTALAVAVRPATTDDEIVGRASNDASIGSPVQLTALSVGYMTTVIAGDEITAGAHLAALNGKAINGSSSLVALENATAGKRMRVVMTASDQSPTVAQKAKAIDTNGQYVGAPDVHMYLLNTGVPARSSATVGSDSVPMYLKAGKFTACTSAGGSSGEYVHLDELSTREPVKSFLLGTTPGQQVKGYAMFNANNGMFSIQWSLPQGQTQPMLVNGVLHKFYNTSSNDKLPDVPIMVKVDSQITWELDPSYYGGKMGNRAVFDGIISKA